MRNGAFPLNGFRIEGGGGGVNGLADWGTGRKDGRRAGREMREVGFMRPLPFRIKPCSLTGRQMGRLRG